MYRALLPFNYSDTILYVNKIACIQAKGLIDWAGRTNYTVIDISNRFQHFPFPFVAQFGTKLHFLAYPTSNNFSNSI